MSRLSRKIKDKRVLKLIRRYLEADMISGKEVMKRREGLPQGSPLSPLLSNILLTELDRELERRGHSYCRYGDDCNIYVRSQRAGEDAMTKISNYLEERLQLRVNREKSGVARPWEHKFLGYSLTGHKKAKLKIARNRVERLKDKVRSLTTGRAGSNSLINQH